MDGGALSQDEIQALLSGMDLSENAEGDKPKEDAVPVADADMEGLLTDVEKDAIGEIANISLGSSATTLFSLVNTKVDITTPRVMVADWASVVADYERPCVFIQIRYTTGLNGSNIMIMKEHDVKIIADLMMGGDGSNTDGELGELHLSAISEAMNQMMGAAATSMSTMLGKMIDISPPEASLIDLNDVAAGEDIDPFLKGKFVKISFRMQVGDLVDSSIMQLYPIDFAKSLYDTFAVSNTPDQPGASTASQPASQMLSAANESSPQLNAGQANLGNTQMGTGMPMGGAPMMGMNMGYPQMNMQGANVQTAQFQNFNNNMGVMPAQENIGLIKDVPLDVTVELGRAKKSISEILDFAPGTIIELDRIAGEPIDVLVNGKFVAKGEVVVIEESFGIRVTEIIN
ncbi:flagellar motor switch phosphatase FliY [Parablautia muri]|uniref:Flagellar motor switch phosphatase FliY n=1 Tax=Parablautia muri TaxID=2320879 RepID=A0A9X5GST9_9FIRM|nr:flagellar motor switch phosphatase FliY [Parablautia muri]NBJ93504.1 flagellar motor switch phosphatase FliY [Parablautia muri]